MATGLGRQKSHKQKVCIWNESNVIEMISKFGWKYKFDFLRGDCCPATFDWSIKWPCHVQFELQIRSLLFCLFLCVCVCVCGPLLSSPSFSLAHLRWIVAPLSVTANSRPRAIAHAPTRAHKVDAVEPVEGRLTTRMTGNKIRLLICRFYCSRQQKNLFLCFFLAYCVRVLTSPAATQSPSVVAAAAPRSNASLWLSSLLAGCCTSSTFTLHSTNGFLKSTDINFVSFDLDLQPNCLKKREKC